MSLLRWSGIQTKYLKMGPYEIGACGIIVAAILLRVVLVMLGWPLLDSDEGTMGVMGLHIANLGEHPIFFYAQGYMGATEAYLAAFLFHFFGVSTLTLRLGLIFLFTLFLIAMYLLTSRIYTKKLALITLVLLCFGSNAVLNRELIVVGGDLETLVCGSWLFLIAAWLAYSSTQQATERNQWHRLLAFAGWGFTAGFGLWSHMLVAPFIVVSGVLLLCFCWRELLSWAPLFLVIGVCIGAYLLIYYNLTAPPGQDSLTLALRVHHANDMPQPPFRVLFPRQLRNALLVTLPTATGSNPVCPTSDVHPLALGNFHAVRCTLMHTGWTLGILLIWTLAVALVIGQLWSLLFRTPGSQGPAERRRSIVVHAFHLALLVNAAMTFALYVVSSDAAFYPVASVRYQIGLLVTTPAMLWPLWNGANAMKPLALRLSRRMTLAVRLTQISVVVGRCVVIFLALVAVFGSVSIFTGIPAEPPIDASESVYVTQTTELHLAVPATRALNRQEATLIQQLEHLGVKHLYSDYWTCNRLIFQSRERILCKALRDGLEDGHDRYQPYRQAVLNDPNSAYAFHVASPPARLFLLRKASGKYYQRFRCAVFAGYQVCYPGSAKL